MKGRHQEVGAAIAGEHATCSVGTVRCWGRNDSDQCTPPDGLSDVVAVAAGDAHSVAILAEKARKA